MSVYVRLEWQTLACVFREQTQCFLRELLGLLRPELAAPPSPAPPCPPSTVLGEDPPQIQRCVLWWVGGGRPLGVSTWQTPCLRAAGMGGTLQKSGPSEPQSREGPG